MSEENSPTSVTYSNNRTVYDDKYGKPGIIRKRAVLKPDHKDYNDPEYEYEEFNTKKNTELQIGDCCFMSKTAPPQYLGKVVNKIKNDDGTIQIDFQQHDGNIYTDIKPENYAYIISPNIEDPNPYAKKARLKGGKKTKRKSKRKSKRTKRTKRTKRKSKKRKNIL
jgi:hypothetical protein